MQHHLDYQNSQLFYKKSGEGNTVILLFHGFGQQHKAFASLAETLSAHCTLYAFDLFFHGNSTWNHGELPLEKERWQKIISRFLEMNQIEKFSVLGFSMGGKFALATVELFPSNIEYLFLLAPDGIKTSFWYSLATYPLLLRQFFKSMILKPNRLHWITSALHAVRLVDKSLVRFAESQMDTQEKRERVYYSWVVFRHLRFDMKQIAQLITDHSIRLTMVVGKHDKIITAKNMNQLLQYLPHHRLEIVDSGHQGVIASSVSVLAHTIRQ